MQWAKTKFRQFLNGMHLTLENGSLNTTATDGHRLSINKVEAPVVDNQVARAIIPRKAITEMTRLLSSQEDMITITISENHIQFISPEFVLTSTLIEGSYPNCEKLVPKPIIKMLK